MNTADVGGLDLGAARPDRREPDGTSRGGPPSTGQRRSSDRPPSRVTRSVGSHRLDDVALLERVACGDQVAFSLLHARYRAVVASVVGAHLHGRDAEDRDDIVQEVFTVAWVSLGDLRDPHRLRPWLLQIARRATIDHARRRRCRPVLDRDERALDVLPDDRPGPDAEAEGADLAARVRRGVGTLSERDSLVIHMVAERGLGLADVAAALDITPNNAAVTLHRARHRLRAAATTRPPTVRVGRARCA